MERKQIPFYEDLDLQNDGNIKNVKSISVVEDASDANDLPRKSQVESIASNAVQGAIVSSLAVTGPLTTLNTEQLLAQLNAKQNVLTVDPSSTSFIEIENSVVKFKDLGQVTFEGLAYSGLTDLLAASTFNGDGTFTVDGKTIDGNTYIVLTNSVDQSDRNYMYKGTNNGDATDFIAGGIDINVATVRNMLAKSGLGIAYDSATGTFSLLLGSGATELGGQTVPHGATFTTINPTTSIKSALEKLEELINAVETSGADGTATLTTRINNLVGVTGSNLGSFTGGLVTENQTVKQVLQQLETLINAAITDRAAIRSEFAAADAILQAGITSEASTRSSADTLLQTNIDSEATARTLADSNLQNGLTNEAIARAAEDSALDGRLDILEGSGAGSVTKAEADAKAYADTKVAEEKARAETVEAAINTKIDNLTEGDIKFIGKIIAGGILSVEQSIIDAGEQRDGSDITTMTIKAGETFVIDVDQTLNFSDTPVTLQNGDKLMAVGNGEATKAKFNIVQADGSAITVANIGSSTIEKNGSNQLDIVANSIGRTQLDAAIETDIDDKQSLTSTNAITSDGDTHFVTSTATAAQQNIYFKREQTSSSALSGTARTLLGELHVSTNGSGNAAVPSYAHTATMATHYNGSSVDLSVVLAGGNFEANGSATSATQATGVYGTAITPQLGVNVGGTFVADGAGISNLGAFGFASTDGDGADRGLYGAVAAMDVVTFSATRTADPVPHDDVAVVADAKYAPAGSKALYAYGDVILEGGTVSVPNASADSHAVNLGDIKGKEAIYQFNLTANNTFEISISNSINLDESAITIYDDGQDITNNLSVVKNNTTDAKKISLTSNANLTDVKLFLKQYSCGITQL